VFLEPNPSREYILFQGDPFPNETAPNKFAHERFYWLVADGGYFPVQWGLKNTGQSGGVARGDSKACGAWEQTTGNSNIVVAVVDQGIEFAHPDFSNISAVSFGGSSYIPISYMVIGIYDLMTNTPIDSVAKVWSVSGNLTLVSGQGTNQIQVDVNMPNGGSALISCQLSAYDFVYEKMVFVGMPPVYTIFGPDTVAIPPWHTSVAVTFICSTGSYGLDNPDDSAGYVWTVVHGTNTVEYSTDDNEITIHFVSAERGQSATKDLYVS